MSQKTITSDNKVSQRDVVITQPDNPKDKTVIEWDSDDSVRIQLGTSHDTTTSVAAIKSLSPVTYTGIGLIIVAILVGLFSKGKQVIWTICLSLSGIGLISLAYLLPTYPSLFMFGIAAAIVLVVGYVVWTAYGFSTQGKAVEDNVKLIENIKEKLTPEQKKELFDGKLADSIQDKNTKRIVRSIRRKQRFTKN